MKMALNVPAFLNYYIALHFGYLVIMVAIINNFNINISKETQRPAFLAEIGIATYNVLTFYYDTRLLLYHKLYLIIIVFVLKR